ncbi:MAG: hypothetical protein PHF86_01415 [Candidatus Nanoarchaeia archaeon]|nr:hypothetical protein [Candidatus Nanoarchaeia archaeon]
MNFIISLVLWAILFLSSAGLKSISTGDWKCAFLVFQVIFSITFFIFFIVAIFYQLDWIGASKRIKNSYERQKKALILYEAKNIELKTYYEKYLGNNYPNFEKDIFIKIAENQPKEIMALFQAYPELKSSLTITDLIKNITGLVGEICEIKNNINHDVEKLENIKTDSWLIWKPQIQLDYIS